MFLSFFLFDFNLLLTFFFTGLSIDPIPSEPESFEIKTTGRVYKIQVLYSSFPLSSCYSLFFSRIIIRHHQMKK